MVGQGDVERLTRCGMLLRPRPRWVLLLLSAGIGLAYVLASFDHAFLSGTGSFWDNPLGAWLNDPADSQISVDLLALLTAYFSYAHAPWAYPLFLVPTLGPPPGASGMFLGIIPIAALLGKMVTHLTGAMVNPYGVWVAAAFVLNAVCATLVMIELGEASLIACVAASVLAISSPQFLHRFGHMELLGQFVVVAALWLYLRDRVTAGWRTIALRWTALLAVTSWIGVYLFVMVGLVYGASWLDRWRRSAGRPWVRWGEPLCVAVTVLAVLIFSGYLGVGQSKPWGWGFGYFSMNLASPFWPQRSGLLPTMWPIVAGTGGQYEGFNYLGAGGVLLFVLALVRDRAGIVAWLRARRGFVALLVFCTLFALSNRIYFFNWLVLNYNFSDYLTSALGIFRSSGRFFWPVYYAMLLGGLALALRHGSATARIATLGLVCVLQLIDTEPLRARMGALTEAGAPMSIARSEWLPRLERARRIVITPTYLCTGRALGGTVKGEQINMELSMLASIVGRPNNSIYNPRGRADCGAEANEVLRGPWQDDVLYVMIADVKGSLDPGFRPPGLHCEAFSSGEWCLGRAN